MKHLLRYSPKADLDLERVQALFPAHQARWAVFQERGTLLAIGPFADPREGALAVVTTREAAEEFVASDPFVLEGVVDAWTISAWDEVLLPSGDRPEA